MQWRCIWYAISAPNPATGQPISTITQRPVFLTDAASVSTSSGRSERISTTSQSMPSCASCFAASRQVHTIFDHAISVMSAPSRLTSAWPSGISSSPSGTSQVVL